MFGSRRFLILGLVLLFCAAIAGLNAIAIMHAKAMTQFVEAGDRTPNPEQLAGISKLKVLLFGVRIPRPENAQTPSDYGKNYHTHNFQNRRGETLEGWHIPALDGKALVLLFHGYAASKDDLLPIATELHATGLDVFLVDFSGSGGSTGDQTTIGFHEAEDVADSFEYARVNWPQSRIVLYGLSMGGAAVLRAAAIHKVTPDGIVVEATYDNMLNTVRNRFGSMEMPSFPFAELLVFWGGRLSGFDAFAHNPAEYAQSVRAPTLVLHGRRDTRVTTGQAIAITDSLRGWRRISIYDEAGHEAVVRIDPKQWRADIEILLRQLTSGVSTN